MMISPVPTALGGGYIIGPITPGPVGLSQYQIFDILDLGRDVDGRPVVIDILVPPDNLSVTALASPLIVVPSVAGGVIAPEPVTLEAAPNAPQDVSPEAVSTDINAADGGRDVEPESGEDIEAQEDGRTSSPDGGRDIEPGADSRDSSGSED